jgi:hypothetical protein
MNSLKTGGHGINVLMSSIKNLKAKVNEKIKRKAKG